MEYDSFDEFLASAGYVIDGIWYPRVTAIVGIKAKPALYRYYANMPGMAAADQAKERSAQEGAAVHDTAEAILRGSHVMIPEAIRPAIEAFTEFLRNNDVNPLLIEERVVSKANRYAGTIDVLAEVNGIVGVLDIKTSLAVYRDYGLQTAAYVKALRERSDIPPPQTSWILRLDQAQHCELCHATLRSKGGVAKVRKGRRDCPHAWTPIQGQFEFVQVPETEDNMAAFLAAKRLWEWEHRDWLQRVDHNS